MPKISAVVPVYNSENTLRRCIDSIIAQEMKDFELILIDDGSNDSSASLCDDYAAVDSRIKVVRKENGGVSSARNVGMEMAEGNWICFIDSDDYVSADFFPEILDDAVDLYLQNWKNFGENNNQEEFFASGVVEKSDVSAFFQNNMCKLALEAPWTKFYRRDIIESHGLRFDIAINLGEDCVFNQHYYHYVDKIEVLDTGHYMYNCVADHIASYSKYRLTVDDAVYFLKELYDAYKSTRYKSAVLLDLEKQGRFERLSLMSLSKKDWLKWKYSDVVYDINCETGKYIGLVGNIKRVLFPLISPLARFLLSFFDKTLLKFIIVGVVNTLFGTAVMFIAYNLFHWSYWVSSALNYILGSILSFFLNKSYTFGQKGINGQMVFRFIVNIAICYLIAYGVAKPAARWAFSGLNQVWQDNIAMCVGMCLFVGLNYIGQRFYVFRGKKNADV